MMKNIKEELRKFINYSTAYLFEELCFGSCRDQNLIDLETSFNRVMDDNLLNIEDYLKILDGLRDRLRDDVDAAFNGDPAAKSKEEIILTYPGFFAVMVYRIAHELYELKIPLIPRVLSEIAHSETGIDINPGAKIGKNFFIDHGTGVVIGETAEIGNNVRLYQGVTIGALSLRNVEEKRGVKRHPTIKDNVIIYSGASILGGNTVIGNNVVIGSNVFLITSVEDNKKVILSHKNYTIEDIIKK